jgi:hypothetical protein
MAALTHVQVLDNVASIVEAGTSLHESAELLNPRWAPEAALNRAFSVLPTTIANTGQYRDRFDRHERARYEIDLLCVWAQDVHNYKTTRDVALADALEALQAIEGDDSAASEQWSVHHVSTSFTVHESREWLFGSVRFRLDTDIEL